MNTERLYYTDCYLREFEARVVAAEPAPHGFRVYLDRSAFYPESGGQPSDRGTLGGIPVLDAVDEDTKAYNAVSEAYKMSRASDAEKAGAGMPAVAAWARALGGV